MADLVAWLTKILVEDEQVAKACLGVNAQADLLNGNAPRRWIQDGEAIYDEGSMSARVGRSWQNEISHIILHDPAAVLADIAAKKEIIALHTACWRIGYCQTLRLLASAYADRPGYLDEWKP